MKQKKCHYIGNCSFAHSLEERDVWTYMKNNSLRDMQQMYEMWLSLTNQNRRADGTLMTPPPEEKQIAMPTDYSESMVGRRMSGGGGDLWPGMKVCSYRQSMSLPVQISSSKALPHSFSATLGSTRLCCPSGQELMTVGLTHWLLPHTHTHTHTPRAISLIIKHMHPLTDMTLGTGL